MGPRGGNSGNSSILTIRRSPAATSPNTGVQMFKFGEEDKSSSKCYASYGTLPAFIDPKQPPTKKKPFSTVCSQPFNHVVDLVFLEASYSSVSNAVLSNSSARRYSQVIFPLSVLLEGEFFNKYIKTGNVIMRSEGRAGVDNVYSFNDGFLQLELNKESYERAGLVGKPVRSGGRKHVKTRYLVELNLRLPSMLHGKKGFERIVWAFKNALNHSVTWLFCDLDENQPVEQSDASEKPIQKHHPITTSCSPQAIHTISIVVPSLVPPHKESPTFRKDLEDYAVDVHEWLALIGIESPRVNANDLIDSYLSRYEIPYAQSNAQTRLVRIRWQGLLPQQWITGLWLECLKNIRRACPLAWFSMSAYGFGNGASDAGHSYTIMRLPPRSEHWVEAVDAVQKQVIDADKGKVLDEYMLWELASAFD